MMRAVICKGDPTSHGGKVLEGNANVTTNGRQVAQRGHMTFCPKCKGNFPIAEGLDFHTYAGIGTAVDGMRTACGAKLMATQHTMQIDDAPAAAPATVAATMAPAAAAGNYSAAFRTLDEESGAPVAGLPYRMLLPDGRTVRGVTDSDGRTGTVSGHDPASVQLFWETSAQTPATEPGGEHD